MSRFRILPGLPPYGTPAISIPSGWGRSAREGLVVEFVNDTDETWVGNFQSGIGGATDLRQHPNGHDVLVVSSGLAWLVDPDRRDAIEVGDGIDGLWSVSGPDGVVLSQQGISFIRLGPLGRLWHTRRLSWDGFKDVKFSSSEITGLAWAPWEPEWSSFTVDLKTGNAHGGNYNAPDATDWEILASDKSA